MSVQVFVAANAREGLVRVRRELGEDAVVLSTRPHPKGVELLASPYGDLAEVVSNDADGSLAREGSRGDENFTAGHGDRRIPAQAVERRSAAGDRGLPRSSAPR